MSTKTTNYSLVKPGIDEAYDIGVPNENMDIIDAELLKKVEKVDGKGLSTNDYTTVEKDKLKGIAEGANENVNADWNATSGDSYIKNKPTIPSKTSDLKNDSNFQNPEQVVVAIKNAGGNYDADLIEASGSIGSENITEFSGFTGCVNYDTDFCVINLMITADIGAGSTATICTLPSGYRPAAAFSDLDAFGNAINISTEGVVTVTAKAAITANSSYIRAYAEW